MSKGETFTVNCDDIVAKRRFMQHIGTLRGLHDVTIKRRIKTRSLNQNAYYHAAVVRPFLDYLRAEWGDEWITHDQAHDILARQILGAVTHPIGEDGDCIEVRKSTRILDKIEFGIYIDKCAAWLAEFAHIVVIPSELFFEAKAERIRKVG